MDGLNEGGFSPALKVKENTPVLADKVESTILNCEPLTEQLRIRILFPWMHE